ncbi:DMT family transporter [Actinomadura algeriensis]|uniref:Drug/metabolite transporter (DMT)-like permease n=1 Tax=Actinomadura algeriensis TaxID=1679523 RepID=A0ABR9JP35_9ACTN|nr:DMT family transporter [Actinomadura algeriensis]MBE1532317.1 drug/metabolite transporter (DMT)-like permease [Actinomadura algeriensis]
MVTILALGAALAYGVADFLGGAVSRRATALQALLWCVPVGFVVVLTAALIDGGAPTATSLTWGFAAGIAGGTGLITFYGALARGPMSVVAPVSALAAAVLPVGAGVLRGERLSTTVIAGVLLCLVAIGMVSMERDKPDQDKPDQDGPDREPAKGRLTDSGPLMAALSGICFGVFFTILAAAGESGGLWPIVGSRVGNLAVVLVAVLFTLRVRGGTLGPRVSGRTLIGLALLSGTLDAGANVLFVFSTQHGMLSLAAVLTSLYPAITVLLARIAYSERLRVVQQVGLAVAATGVVLVTAG